MSKHDKVLVFGDHQAEGHSKGTSPAGQHWAILKKIKVCVRFFVNAGSVLIDRQHRVWRETAEEWREMH